MWGHSLSFRKKYISLLGSYHNFHFAFLLTIISYCNCYNMCGEIRIRKLTRHAPLPCPNCVLIPAESMYYGKQINVPYTQMSNWTTPKCLQSFIKMNKHNNNENSTASSSSPRNLSSKLLIILSLCHGVIYIFPCRGVRKACSIQRKGCSIVAFYSVYHNILSRNGYDSICTGEGNFVQAAIEASNIHIWAGSDKRSATINATIAPMQWCQLFLGKWRTIVVGGRLYAKTTKYGKGHLVCRIVTRFPISVHIWDSVVCSINSNRNECDKDISSVVVT